jgi:hypothetical protein
VLIFGHTHKPYTKRVDNVLFLNAGSIGKPQDGDPRACYVVLDISGDANVEFRRIPYDVQTVATAIRQSDLPDNFATDIETGGAPGARQTPEASSAGGPARRSRRELRHPSGRTLHADDVVLHPGEYSYRVDVAEQREAVAAEENVVVLLDIARDDSLRMEGDARDLNRVIQDLRKGAHLRYSDRIVMSISGDGVEPLLAAFGPWLMEQALAVSLTTTQLDEFIAAGPARLGSGAAHVAIGLAPSDGRGPAQNPAK